MAKEQIAAALAARYGGGAQAGGGDPSTPLRSAQDDKTGRAAEIGGGELGALTLGSWGAPKWTETTGARTTTAQAWAEQLAKRYGNPTPKLNAGRGGDPSTPLRSAQDDKTGRAAEGVGPYGEGDAANGDALYRQRRQEQAEAKNDIGRALLELLSGAAQVQAGGQNAQLLLERSRQQEANAQALREAWTHFDTAREATDWEGRQELIDEYRRLQRSTNNSLNPINQANVKRMREIREKLEAGDLAAGNGERVYSGSDRLTAMVNSGGSGIGSAGANLLANLSKTYGTQEAIRQASSAERMLSDRLLGVDWQEDVRQTREAVTGEEAQAAYAKLDAVADKLREDAAQELQRAKEGLGFLGQAGVDVATNLMEMGFDTIVGAPLGSPLVPMFARVYGQSVGEAREAGASAGKQALYGLTKAGIEVATEKMFDVFGVLGGGSMEGQVEKLVGRLAESDLGRTFLRVLISSQGEGVEELVSGFAEPFAKLIIDNHWQGWDWSDIAYSYIIGSTIGLIGEGTQLTLSDENAARNFALTLQDAGLGGAESQAESAWDVLTGRVTPEQQQERERRAREKLGVGGRDPSTAPLRGSAQDDKGALRSAQDDTETEEVTEAVAARDYRDLKSKAKASVGQIKRFIQNAFDLANTFDYIKVADIQPELSRILQNAGIQITEGVHALRDNDIRHIRKSHGDLSHDKYQVTAADIANVPYIVEHYDTLYQGYDTKSGNPTVVYEYSDGTRTFYVEEVLDKGTLSSKQMMIVGANSKPSFLKKYKKISSSSTDTDVAEQSRAKGESPPGNHVQDAIEPAGSDTTVPQRSTVVKTNSGSGLIWAGSETLNTEGYDTEESTAVNTDPAEHTADEQRVVEEYRDAVDEGLAEYIRTIQEKGSSGVKPYELKPVSARGAEDILRITGVRAAGNATRIEPRMIEHILNRHGENGKADHSMRDVNDIARVQYVLDHYDDVVDGGRTKAYRTVKQNGMTGQAKTVLFSKAVNGTYYVVEAVPDTRSKTVYVVSTYMQNEKPGAVQAVNAADAATHVTSETKDAQTPGSPSIAPPAGIVNTNSTSGVIWAGSERAAEGGGSYSNETGGQANAEESQAEQGVLGQAQTQQTAGAAAARRGAENRAAADAAAGAPASEPEDADAERERVPDAGSRRNTGESSGGETGSLAERTRRHRERAAEQRQRAADLRYYGNALRERGEITVSSSRELGIANGTDTQDLLVMSEEHYDERLRNLAEQVRSETGYEDVVFVIGSIHTVNGGKARGAITGNRIIIQADHSRVPAENIAAHESFHAFAAADPDLVEEAREKIAERFTPEEFRRMLDSYIDNLTGSIIELDESTDPENIQTLAERVMEELLADAYADINAFGLHADQYGDTVRRTVEERRGMQEQNRSGERETRGPPERFSYGGETAWEGDFAALDVAEEMEREGADAETIRQDTGWFRGMDGKWRFEIDDSAMELRGDYRDFLDNQHTERGMRLSELIYHSSLFNQYPQLASIDVAFDIPETSDTYGNWSGSWGGAQHISLNQKLLADGMEGELLDTLIHEMQHAIQDTEGFASGSNPRYWERQLKEGYDGRTRAEREASREAWERYNQIREEDPEFFEEAADLMLSTPDSPRGAINWDTFEQLEPDPPEWQEFDARRDALEEKYGEEKMFNFMDLYHEVKSKETTRRSNYELYRKTAGEIEARDATNRRGMNTEQRKAKRPDIDQEDVVFARSRETGYALRDKKSPTREELEAKEDIPVVDIREETSGSFKEQRDAFLNSEEAQELYREPALNRDTNELLFITPASITHTFSNAGQENILLAKHLREIAENAILTHGEPSRKAPRDHATGVYKFFGAVQTADGVQPVKLTVKEFNVEGQDVPKAVLDYVGDLREGDTYAPIYDGKVLVLEGVEKEATGSARATSETSSDGDAHPVASDGETSSSAASPPADAGLDNHPSVPTISVKDLLDLVKGEDAKYIPQREASDSTRFSVDDEGEENMPSDRELLLTAASRENAGKDLTAYAKKNGRIETLERKLTNLQEAMKNADEEELPQLEALAQKTEKQLSRAEDDLKKMESNPVLKRALDKERAGWREENPTEAARAMRTLREENAAMRELVDYWKGQAKRTSDTDRTVMPEDIRRMARNLLREHSSEASTDRIAGKLQELGNYLVSSDELDFRTLQKGARAVAREIVDNSYTLIDESADIREQLRDYLRSTRLKISDELRGDMTDLADFRRRNMGTLRLANEGRDIDSAYEELSGMFGEGFFPKSITAHADQLNQILDVMDQVQPSYEHMYSRYERDEVIEHVTNEIIDGLISGDVRQSKTYADRRYEHMARRNADLGERNQELNDRLRDERRNRRQLVQEKVSKLRQRSVDRDKRYRKRVAIDKTVKRLSKYLTENSAKNHVPDNMKSMVGNLLLSIDTLSRRSGEKAQREYLRRMNDVARVVANQQKYMNGGEMENSMFLDLPHELGDILSEHMTAIQDAVENDRTWTTARMDLQQLEELDTILNAVSKAITTANDLMADANSAKVSEVSQKTIQHLDDLGPAKADNKATRFLQFQNTTPYYFFKRFGEGGQLIFHNLQEGWGKLGFNSKEVIDYAEKAYTGEECKKAESDVQEFKLHTRTLEEDGTENLRSEEAQTVRLTKAQIMELYTLSKRQQALGHILGAGIRIGDIKDANGKTIHQADNYLLTMENLTAITGTLSAREKEIADTLQKHMNTKGSDWGNEVSMARFGIRQFTEENYWPIKTDSRSRAVRDPGADATNLFRLLNMSFTKSTVRDASNAVVIGSAFDTYANHMADMAKYNALGLPMLDAMKWFSYNAATDPNSQGQYTTTSVQKSAERAYGTEAQHYFIQFMKDMNGTHEGGRDLEQFGSKMLSNYKVAAVGANLRVAMLQPTAYVRAANVLDPKHLAKGLLNNKQGRKEAMRYSGTAVWKDLGFYDTNINNGLRSMIKHSDSAIDQIKDKSMILVELGDKTTWGAIWNACKSQVSEEKSLRGEALMKATAELFDEVIYRTQVMDSTMTRSHSMRQKGIYAGMTTGFMSEPTLSYNMVLDAFNEYQQEQRKSGDANKALAKAGPKVARTMAVYAATAAAASIVESLMDAWRDDDKYQSFVQKWLEAEFGEGKLLDGNLMQDLLIHNKLPLIKDFDSLINGYSNSRMDTEWISNIIKTYNIWKESLQLATGKLQKPTDVTYNGKMTLWGKLYQTLKTLSQIGGLPVGNAGREVIALYNYTIGKVTGNVISTYSPGAKNEIKYAVKDGWLSGDEAQRILLEEGIIEDEAEAGAEVLKWVAESQGESIATDQARAVQALTSEGGVTKEEAVTTTAQIWEQIAALEPLPGRAGVTKTQKYQTIANSDLPVEQQFTMLAAIMEESEVLKTQTAYDYGIMPKTYFDAKVSMYNVSSDGQVSKEEARLALDGQRDLTNEERAVIWQLQNKKFNPKDNPYDTAIGNRVYGIITGKTAEGSGSNGLTLGQWGDYASNAQQSAPANTGLTLGQWGDYASSTQTNIPASTDLELGAWG